MNDRWKKCITLVLGVFFVWTLASCAGMSLDEAVKRSAADIMAKLPAGSRVVIVAFDAEDENVSNYVMDELSKALTAKNLEVQILSHRDLAVGYLISQRYGEISAETAVSIGVGYGAKYVITGQFTWAGNGYQYRLTGINVETAARMHTTLLTVKDYRALQTLIAGLRENAAKTLEAKTLEDNRLNLISTEFSTSTEGSTMEIRVGVDLTHSLNEINKDTAKHTELRKFIYKTLYGCETFEEALNNTLKYASEFSSSTLEYNQDYGLGLGWEVTGITWGGKNGKYFFIANSYGMGGSSGNYTERGYIIDTEEVKIIDKKDIFVSTADPAFKLLISKYTSWGPPVEPDGQDDLFDSLEGFEFDLLCDERGVWFAWWRPYPPLKFCETLVPYSEISYFMTPLGREIFK